MKPKALTLILCLVTFIFVFQSCSKSKDDVIPNDDNGSNIDDNGDDNGDDQPGQKESLVITIYGSANIETSEMMMEHKKDASLIIVQSDKNWTATSDAGWITLADYSGEAGVKGIIVGASKNEFIPRNSLITIEAGSNQHIIHVNQKGAPVIHFSVGGVEFKMILVEGGNFMMGDSDLTESRWAHQVSVNSFYMCETEVTNAQWLQIMDSLPYDDLEGYEEHDEYNMPDHPVSAVSWNEITDQFLPSISELTGQAMRLPTEAEWEYAAMGGKYSEGYPYSGGAILNEVAWSRNNSVNRKQQVAQLNPNELGLYDMSGNVSEWCSDWYKSGYDSNENDNPTGPETGTEKVIRGGDYSQSVMFGHGAFYVKARWKVVPNCYSGCWGDTGNPDEPLCFRCQRVGFRFVMTF